MEREACVCDHGFERSDLCAEIIIIIIIIIKIKMPNKWRTIKSLVLYTKFDFTVDEGKKRLNASRDEN